MTDKAVPGGAFGAGADTQPRSAKSRSRRVDPVSLVAGLLFIAIALAAVTDRYWADIDPVLIVGGSTVAVGITLMVSAVLRHRRRGQSDEGFG
jgi:uncharacterized membrane protein HdeD (DUF308 family)